MTKIKLNLPSILKLYIAFLLLTIYGCSLDSKWKCFGASSPVDLEIVNGYDSDIKLMFLIQSKNEYEMIGSIKIKDKESKVFCIENEGSIKKGLYVYFEGRVSKIILSPNSVNRLSLRETAMRINLSKELLEALK